MQFRFDHETLDVYKLSLEVSRWFSVADFPRGWAWLRDQGVRSAGSVPLNIAEGRSRAGAARKNHYRIAMGSAAEACAVLDIIELPGGTEHQEKLRRVGAMLAKLSRV